MSRSTRNWYSSRGFTLVEVLVALAILAMALPVLLQLFSSSFSTIGVAERYRVATMMARSILDDVGAEIPLVPGRQTGEIGHGLTWVVQIDRAATVNPIALGEVLHIPYDVAVSVSWEEGRTVALTTLQIVPEFTAQNEIGVNTGEEGSALGP